jgi:transcriptional regulator with XRE-family HTH domain
MMRSDAVNIIFGMKLRQARMEANLSLSELATRADLSPSYVTEIEKGRKYPKSDKIFKIAQVLGKTYDELVSIKLSPALTDLESMLASPLLRQFPFEEFDLDINDLIGLLTRAPDKASALLHAVFEIARQYDMKDEHFLRAALRSYQELHDNYFPELETAAADFARRHGLHDSMPVSLEGLTDIICNRYGYRLDDSRLALEEDRPVALEFGVVGQPPTPNSRATGRSSSRASRRPCCSTRRSTRCNANFCWRASWATPSLGLKSAHTPPRRIASNHSARFSMTSGPRTLPARC